MFISRSVFFLIIAALRGGTAFVLHHSPSLSFDTSLNAGYNEPWTTAPSSRKQFMSVLAGSTWMIASSAAQAEGIEVCKKDPGGAPANCVSTASVKQVDLYMAPWTWSEGISAEEIMARLKGAISADPLLTIDEQTDTYMRVKATRNFATPNFATDELQFVIKPEDRIVIFQSKQIDGPTSLSDFGANRKRLEEVRKRAKVFNVMGAEFASADAGPREGAVGQLKAFWGLQSGGGYESVLLDDE